jgi:hypothetical protein
MAEKARRLTIAGRPESFARAITILEIDLRGVLRRHDPPSRTGGRGSLSRSGEDFLMRHIPRRKKTLCRHLSTPIASHSSQHQGSRLHHPLAQRRSHSLSAHIAKITDMKPFVAPHRHPLTVVQPTWNHSRDPGRIAKFSSWNP